MTMMTMISKPNFKKAEYAAYNLLEQNKVTTLPIKVKSLVKHIPNLKIKTYSWYASTHNLTIEETCEHFESDEGCCWYRKSKGSYVIFYNDRIENKGRVRWTIAHEIGHFILKHNEITNKTIFNRNSLTSDEYDVFEKEANCFARNLLAPQSLMYELRPTNPNVVSDIFNISLEAAKNVLDFFNNGLKKGIIYSRNTTIHKLFNRTIQKYKYGKTCLNCACFFIQEHAQFCKVCGSTHLIQGEEKNMEFASFILDDNGRALNCPTCNNQDLHGEYCHICGTYLVNKCTGISVEEKHDPRISWHKLEGCGTLLEGNARFCHNCGCTSTYYLNDILEYWKEENTQQQVDEIPF